MGTRYTVSRTGTALSTTNDYMTIIAPSTRAVLIHEIRVVGGGTASAAAEVLVSRSTVGTTPGGTITPTPLNTLGPAATTSVPTTWAAQPTIGVTIRRIAVNANGAINPVIAMPGSAIEVPPSGQISIRSGLGTSLVSIEVLFEEIG